MRWFKQTSLLGEGQKSLRLGNGEYVSMKAIRQVILSFNNNRTLFLSDYLFVQDFKRNLIFVSYLYEHGLTVQFNSLVSIKSTSSVICSNDLLNGL